MRLDSSCDGGGLAALELDQAEHPPGAVAALAVMEDLQVVKMALASRQLEAPTVAAAAYGQVVAAAVAVIASLSEQLVVLEVALTQAFSAHREARDRAEPARAWAVLGARVLAEFGYDPDRYATAKARKAYAGTAPITRASGLGQLMLARSVGTGGRSRR